MRVLVRAAPLALLGVFGLTACGAGDPAEDDTMARAAGQAELEAVRGSFGPLETLAGAGRREDDVNEWSATFEGGPAVDAELSSPHNALGDPEGNVYIADKEAHAIRQVTTDGRIVTFVGVNQPGDDGDGPGDAKTMHLDLPNGIWLSPSGTLYVLDLANGKVRRVSGGTMTTLFVASSLGGGRGLWVAEDESMAYVSAGSALLRWTPAAGVTTFSGGFVDLGNIFVDDAGTVFATDRGQSQVFRVGADGAAEPFAGTGARGPVLDGSRALETPLQEVRGIWRHPSGGFFLGTHDGSQVLYLDSHGFVHVLIDGARGAHCCDGAPLASPDLKISEVRNVTMTPAGDLLVTEHDAGYVRIARHAP